MLPEFVKRDLFEVLAHLRRAGCDLEEQWFVSHLEFRFPKIGSISAEGVELELRHALEPWNVLAEESISGGTVRTVDSSLERIQVKLSGITEEFRYVVVCNGRRVPLQFNREAGAAFAGIRFRARSLSTTLHPTVPVHAPLVFDLVDCWKDRSIGQCAYHVSPPDGRLYTARPANGAEAEIRRRERFQVAGPALSPMAPPEDEANPIFPLTLDLRLSPPKRKTQIEIQGFEQ
jgi:uncharacterized protein (DUF2126 family)